MRHSNFGLLSVYSLQREYRQLCFRPLFMPANKCSYKSREMNTFYPFITIFLTFILIISRFQAQKKANKLTVWLTYWLLFALTIKDRHCHEHMLTTLYINIYFHSLSIYRLKAMIRIAFSIGNPQTYSHLGITLSFLLYRIYLYYSRDISIKDNLYTPQLLR